MRILSELVPRASLLLHVALGGVLGTIGRFALQGWIQHRAPGSTFPSGTLVVNILGSFLLGFALRFATGSAMAPELRAGIAIGFCGAFTTMSTFGYETVALFADGVYWRAAVYVAATLFGSLVAVVTGMALATRLL